ncbi:type II toxin-antitoxin system VapC family toxin [Mongoliitalea lutea]|uniref:Ribonuclease VapC n=1 Tax=Mongoliitalea lutea TaxID=849756 RepID=A0A8J3D165_9BACT|nr:type II toxin-antitoxin system VapC family toxin [Mongoliitalea lutea]GHB48039.1 twitching motility protein PilT [Mongoliitalea lutea]
MRYLLDTNICIYFLKGRFNLVEKFEQIGFENLYISEITLAELKFGAEKSEFPTKNREIINEFSNRIKLIPIFKAIDIFAKEKARLRKTGRVVDDFDLLIGSSAIVNNMVLITNNEKHFIDLEGIALENWSKE